MLISQADIVKQNEILAKTNAVLDMVKQNENATSLDLHNLTVMLVQYRLIIKNKMIYKIYI